MGDFVDDAPLWSCHNIHGKAVETYKNHEKTMEKPEKKTWKKDAKTMENNTKKPWEKNNTKNYG